METPFIVAGIGARITPYHVLKEMTAIGEWARENGIWIRSGAADGADQAFEKGACQNAISYLPWKFYNKDRRVNCGVKYIDITAYEYFVKNIHIEDFIVNNKIYDLNSVSRGHRLLILRNGFQLLGNTPNSPKTNLVVCWTPGGAVTGGTGVTIKMANVLGIPVFNMFNEGLNTADKVISCIERTFHKELGIPPPEPELIII